LEDFKLQLGCELGWTSHTR